MRSWQQSASLLITLGILMCTPAFAKDDRVSFANDIVIEEGSNAGDLVCMLCSVKVHGDVHGDVVTVLGSVTIDDGHSISGDLATVGGDVSLGDGASIHRDVAVVGGNLHRGSGATIDGDSEVMAGKGWLFVPLAPLLIFIGIIWLIVWFVTRRRYTQPMNPQRRGY